MATANILEMYNTKNTSFSPLGVLSEESATDKATAIIGHNSQAGGSVVRIQLNDQKHRHQIFLRAASQIKGELLKLVERKKWSNCPNRPSFSRSFENKRSSVIDCYEQLFLSSITLVFISTRWRESKHIVVAGCLWLVNIKS